MDPRLLLKLSLGIALYLTIASRTDNSITALSHLENTPTGMTELSETTASESTYTKLSDTSTISGGKRKNDWRTMFVNSTSNNTTPDALTSVSVDGPMSSDGPTSPEVLTSPEEPTSPEGPTSPEVPTLPQGPTSPEGQFSVTLKEIIEEQTTSVEELTTPVYKMDPCLNVGTCNFTKTMKHKFCKCDENCPIYNDCCFNVDIAQQISRFTPFINCFKGTSLPNQEGFFAVGICPDLHSNITEKQLCADDSIIRNGPSVAGPDGMIFKNQYCALCHGIIGVESFDVTFYIQNTKVLESVLRMTTNFTRAEKLKFMFDISSYQEIAPAHVTLRPCIVSTRRNNEELCQAYVNPMYIWSAGNFYFYRNYFCAPDIKQKVAKCLGEVYDKIAVGTRWSALPASVMFAFLKKEAYDAEDACDVWSQKLDEEGRCIYKQRISNFKFTFSSIKLVANRPLPFYYLNMIAKRFGLSHEIGNWSVLNYITFIAVGNSSIVHVVDMDLTMHTTMFEDEMRTLKWRITNMQWKMHILDEILRRETIVIKETLQETSSKSKMFDIYENETGMRPEKIYELEKPFRSVAICRNKKICDNTIVSVLISNITETMVNCKDRSIVTNNTTFIKTIATYTCFTISVLALCLLIILYRKLGMISNIPGSNLENISISLLLSKVLFMVGIGWSDIRELCYVIGVLLHYLWLSTFCFMSISVMCIVITLTKMQSNGTNRQDSLNSKKRRLTLCGIISPLLFVCPAILLDVYGDEYFSAGYGLEPCFPNHFPSNLIFFSGPVMLFIAVNFICLVTVICRICKLSHEIGNISRHISMSTPFTNAKVYIRVLILSGLFWSVGILTAFIDEEWVGFLFTILCGLQGFFISLASLTTTRVIRDLRRLKDPTNN